MELNVRGVGSFFWGDENVLQLVLVMVTQPYEDTKTSELYFFLKWRIL